MSGTQEPSGGGHGYEALLEQLHEMARADRTALELADAAEPVLREWTGHRCPLQRYTDPQTLSVLRALLECVANDVCLVFADRGRAGYRAWLFTLGARQSRWIAVLLRHLNGHGPPPPRPHVERVEAAGMEALWLRESLAALELETLEDRCVGLDGWSAAVRFHSPTREQAFGCSNPPAGSRHARLVGLLLDVARAWFQHDGSVRALASLREGIHVPRKTRLTARDRADEPGDRLAPLGLTAMERDLFAAAVDLLVKGDLEYEGSGREGFRARAKVYRAASRDVLAVLVKHLPDDLHREVERLLEDERKRVFTERTALWPKDR